MEHHKFKVEKTAHVFTHNTPSVETQYFWFVTHGYGQLASNIIRKFEQLDGAHFVVAPEGLNRFYWEFGGSKVSANWMTKQDRLDDIDNYCQYLKTVYTFFKEKLSPSVKIILFGFSQGCATQIRWMTRELPECHNLVLWGGMLPEDIDYQPFKEYLYKIKIEFVCGNQDEFINDERINWHLNFAKEQNIHMDLITFEGKHEVLTEVLFDIFTLKIKN